MQNLFLSYLKKIIIYTFSLVLIAFLIYWLIPQEYQTLLLPYIFIFFFVLTTLVHFILIKNAYNEPSKFIRWFMSASMIKLIIHITIMIVYALNFKTNAKIFILTYSFFYLFYTGFEIYIIISDKSRMVKGSQKNN